MLSLGPRSLGILSVKADFSKAAFGGRRHINVSLLQLQHSYSTVTRKRSKIYSPVTVGTHYIYNWSSYSVLRCPAAPNGPRNRQIFARLRRAPSLAFLGRHA